MFPAGFHPRRWHRPHCTFQVDLIPPRAKSLPGARRGKDYELEHHRRGGVARLQTGHEGRYLGVIHGRIGRDDSTITFVNADRMLKRDRKWFRVSEIADQCAEISGSVELDQDKRALALEKLRTAILEGEFNDPKGRSKVACLHSSPVIPIRFHQYGAGMSDDFLKLTSHLWISRADCSAWFSRKGYEFPKEWVKTEEQEKQTPRGPKPIFRQPIRNAVFELMGHHGDLTVDDPVWSRQQTLKKLFVTNWPATSRAPVRSASTYRHSSKNGDVTKADN